MQVSFAERALHFKEQLQQGNRTLSSPAQIMGAEQEFEVWQDGVQIDFRTLFDQILSISGLDYRRAWAHGAFLETGSLLCCDAWEAEIAVPPETIGQDVAERLTQSVLAHRSRLCSFIDAYNERYLTDIRLRGYSSHLSAFCPELDPAEVARVYAATMAPVMMLLLDREDSPGLLIRPRSERFEIGGDYLENETVLLPATVFFLGSYLAVFDALRSGDSSHLPPKLDVSKVLNAVGRPGLFVDRSAYGEDLYKTGRNAQLSLADGSTMRAGDYAKLCWSSLRPYLVDQINADVLSRAETRLLGDVPLPSAPIANSWVTAISNIDLALSEHQAAFVRRCRPAFEIFPHFVDWKLILYRIQSAGEKPMFAKIPLLDLKGFHAAVENGQLDKLLSAAPPEASGSFVLDGTEDPGQPGLFTEVAPSFYERFAKGKKDSGHGCEVTLTRDKVTNADVIQICIPETRDPLKEIKRPEPPLNASVEGVGVMLHSGAFHLSELDLQVKARGFPFQILRHYRSGIEYDGICGRGWDHIYNKRIVPTRPEGATSTPFGWCETFAGSETSRSSAIEYCDGMGRRTHYDFEKWELRTVRKWWTGDPKTFRAVVTTYKQRPGERWQIKRYAVVSGDAGWNEPIFYVMRTHDGTRIIFNCHGYIIAWLDRHLNTMRFEYGAPFNPQTKYDVLRVITDTTGRRYQLDYTVGADGIPKLEEWTDPWQRKVSFRLNSKNELSDVLSPKGQHFEHRLSYRYRVRAGLLAEVVAPREASGTTRSSYLAIEYDSEERVTKQRKGSPPGVTPVVGGSYLFEYNGDSVKTVIDRRGEKTDYTFKKVHHTAVVETRTLNNQTRNIPHVRYSEPSVYTWRLAYDDDFRVKTLTDPRGGTETYIYDTANAPLFGRGEERDWVERNITWDNDLSKGNMLSRVVRSYRSQDGSRTQTWTYEWLFNQKEIEKLPVGTIRYHYDHRHPWRKPQQNGVPIKIEHPSQLTPSGAFRSVIETFTYDKGGLVNRRTDPDNVTTETEYDPNGAINKVTVDPDLLALTIVTNNDSRGNPLETIVATTNITRRAYDDRDNMISETLADGADKELFYDQNDQLVRTQYSIKDLPAAFDYPRANTRRVEDRTIHDILGQIIAQEVDSLGIGLREEFAYDPEGNPLEHRFPRATGARPEDPGNRIAWEYDSLGNRYKETAAPGTPHEQTRYWLNDEFGRPRFNLRADRALYTFLHNGFGERIQTRDPIGTVTHHQLDQAGRVVRTRVYGYLGGPVPGDRRGKRNQLLSDQAYQVDRLGRPIRTTTLEFELGGSSGNTRSAITTTEFSPGGNLMVKTDAVGRQTKHRYDSASRLVTVEYPGGNTTSYQLSPTGKPLQVRHRFVIEGKGITLAPSPQRMEISRTYDVVDRLTSETMPGAGVSRFAYDSLGNQRAVQLNNGAIQQFKYDTVGRKTDSLIPASSNSDLIRNQVSYWRNGLPKEKIDGLGNRTRYSYDALDRLAIQTDPDGRTERSGYDLENRLALQTARDRTQIRTEYDPAGRPKARTHKNPAMFRLEQHFEWNGLGFPTKARDNNDSGSELILAWNSLGSLKQETQDTFNVRFDYDPSGQLQRLRYPSGEVLEIDQHPSGKPATFARRGYHLAQYRYLGDRVEERQCHTLLHAPGSGPNDPPQRHSFPLIKKVRFNAQGQLTGQSHYLHDAVTDPSSPQDIVIHSIGGLRYDAAGRITKKTTPDYSQIYDYDYGNRLRSVITDPIDLSGQRRREQTHGIDAAGNNKVTVETRTSVLGRQRTLLTNRSYNSIHAITKAKTIGEPVSLFTHNARGDLRASDHHIWFGGRREKVKRTLGYDALGRLSMVFVRPENRLLDNTRIIYRYDAQGRRILRREERVRGSANILQHSRETRYVFWGDRVLEEWERVRGEPFKLHRRYYHGVSAGEIIAMDIDEGLVGEDIDNSGTSNWTTLFFLDDHERTIVGTARSEYHGSSLPILFERVNIDSNGARRIYVFDSQGRPSLSRRSFTEHDYAHHGRKYHPKEGLYYNGRRFYDPATGRFTGRDPLGAWGDMLSFGNAYTYAANNPIHYVDNEGELALTAAGTLILTGAYFVATYTAAEATEKDWVAGFSPGHQLSVAVHGEHHFSGRAVSTAHRVLAGVDAGLSLIPGGAFFGKGAVSAGRGLKAIAYARGADHVFDVLKIGQAVTSAGYGAYTGWQSGNAAQIGLSLLSLGLQGAHIRNYRSWVRRPPHDFLDNVEAIRRANPHPNGNYTFKGSFRRDGRTSFVELFWVKKGIDAAPPSAVSGSERFWRFMGTRKTDRGVGASAQIFEEAARMGNCNRFVVNGYNVHNPSFSGRWIMSFITSQFGFRAYSARLSLGMGIQLVKNLD